MRGEGDGLEEGELGQGRGRTHLVVDERRAAVEQELRAAAHLEHVIARHTQLPLPRRRRRRRRRRGRRREQRAIRVGRREVRARAARVG